jgi:hypothetical protein
MSLRTTQHWPATTDPEAVCLEAVSSLERKLSTYLPASQVRRVRRAFDYAKAGHEGQLRQSGEPYISHPLAVTHILADMHSVMLLAGSTDDSRKWAWTYCTEVTGPALQKIAQRYQRTKVMSVTTGERKVLGEFITRYREFWLRQPLGLYEAACAALQEHYDKMGESA